MLSFKLLLAILWHVIEAAVRGGCRHHYCSSYTGASECTGTREICPGKVLSYPIPIKGGGCSLWSPACLESFRCTYYTTPSVGWDIQEVRFHCNFSFRPLLLQSEKLCNEIKLLIDRKIWTMIKFSNHGAISTWYSFSKFTLQSVVSTICNLPKI